MKVQYAPLVSDVRGRFGGLVMSAWRGVRVCRRFRAPANPNSADQQDVRMVFRNCHSAWLKQQTETRNAWNAFEVGKDFTGRNAYIGKQVPALKDSANCTPMVGTPGDASTLELSSLVVTEGAGTLDTVPTPPTPPSGWSVSKVVVYIFLDEDWTSALHANVQKEEEDDAAPWVADFAGLGVGDDYQVRGFVVWEDPNGKLRYSSSIGGLYTAA